MLHKEAHKRVCWSSPVGFMTPEERKLFEDIRSPHLKYWIPVVWFSNLASKARQEGRIEDNVDLQNLLNVTTFKSKHSYIWKQKHKMKKTVRNI